MDYDKLKSDAKIVIKRLIKRYGKDIPIFLHYHKNKPYEFLFSVMMSAQCTDKRVNEVTKELYKKYDTLEKFAKVNIKTLEKDIHSVGFYHNKAKGIINTANILLDEYDGKIPKDRDKLMKLPSVGRKTANVVLGHIFNIPSLAVDTHVMRISTKIFNLKKKKDPLYIEEELMKIIPKKYYVLWNTHIISLGREICTAKSPKCNMCPINDICMAKSR